MAITLRKLEGGFTKSSTVNYYTVVVNGKDTVTIRCFENWLGQIKIESRVGDKSTTLYEVKASKSSHHD